MAASSSGEGLQQALREWQKVELGKLQGDLDADAEEIERRRKTSAESRKTLVQEVKTKRQGLPEDVRKAMGPVVKLLQGEVDALARRAKQGEDAFLNVYERMMRLSDPTPWLQYTVQAQARMQSAQELEIENTKLKETIREYREEFADVRNQEVTIKQLREKLQELEGSFDKAVNTKVQERERQLARQQEESERAQQNEQLALVTKQGSLEQEIKTLQKALEDVQNENLEFRSRMEQEAQAQSETLDMTTSDLERASQRIEDLEKELELERTRTAQASAAVQRTVNHQDEQEAASRGALEQELAIKDRELSQLVSDLHTTQAQLSDLRQRLADVQSHADAAQAESRRQLEDLEGRLEEMSDYDEIKRELAVFRRIEAGEADAQETGAASKPLELLLLEKNRALESENTELKLQAQQALASVQELTTKRQRAESTAQEQHDLIARLEDQLSSVKGLDGRDTSGSPRKNVNEKLLTGGMSGAADAGGTGGTGDDSVETILPIVTSQRDRFRQRNLELEAEVRHERQANTSLRNEIDSLRSDNVKLYEKMKYMQTYSGAAKNTPDDVVDRYSSQYEEHINPFNAFNAKEKQRRYMSMTPSDRITLTLGRAVLSNKYARMAFVCYALLLHALIFLVLYKYSHTAASTLSQAEQCHKLFAASGPVGNSHSDGHHVHFDSSELGT